MKFSIFFLLTDFVFFTNLFFFFHFWINFYFQFLNSMKDRGLIEVKEFPKGVENIISINQEHDDIRSFILEEVSQLFLEHFNLEIFKVASCLL